MDGKSFALSGLAKSSANNRLNLGPGLLPGAFVEVSMIFPTWRYHKTLEPRIVHSKEELDALGSSWVDNPAAFEKVEQASVEEKAEVVEAPKPKRRKKD